MPLQLQYEIEGEVQLQRTLQLADAGVKDFTEPLERIEGEVMKSFDRNFSQRGGLFGTWPARSPKSKGDWPLLERTGDMRGSFVSAVTSTQVEFGNTAEYFKYHQSNKPRSRIPRRVMMKLDQIRRTYIVKSFQAYLIKITRTRT